MKWFDVNKEGLGKLLAGRGPEFIGRELVQNALDENTTAVVVTVEWDKGTTYLRVTDDSPEGFHDLTHAWTLFAESKKKTDAEKRGRFNLGEKLVLALCKKAQITTTTGRVTFDKKGRHRTGSVCTPTGSVFEGWMPQTKRDNGALLDGVLAIIPPKGVKLEVNGFPVQRPPVVKEIAAKRMLTEIAGEDGVLKRTERNTTITLLERNPDYPAYLHEMGIPVVELEGHRWHVDVGQKIPLTLDRDNVRPSYLRRINQEVLSAMYAELDGENANTGWVREASKDPNLSEEAMSRVLDLRFGAKRVAHDPSDPEANMRAVSLGYTVVHGRQLSKEEWANAKRTGSLLPAGQVTPSNKAEVQIGTEDTVTYPEEKWTDAMRWVVEHTTRIATALVGVPVFVGIRNHFGGTYTACYGGQRLYFNVARLGKRWFTERREAGPHGVDLNELIIHELGHHYSNNHLDERYHDALCRLGAKLAQLAAAQPELFRGKEVQAARK